MRVRVIIVSVIHMCFSRRRSAVRLREIHIFPRRSRESVEFGGGVAAHGALLGRDIADSVGWPAGGRGHPRRSGGAGLLAQQ